MSEVITHRAVPEWIGFDADAPIPKRVKLRLLIKYGGKCYRTGHKFRPGDKIEFDHIKALCLAPPGENWNRESNIAPILGGKVHGEKTAADVAMKAKCDRIQAKPMRPSIAPEPPSPRPKPSPLPTGHGAYLASVGALHSPRQITTRATR